MFMLSCDYKRVIEYVVFATQEGRDFHIDPSTILPNSVKVQGISRNKQQVTAEPYQLPVMPLRQPTLYYMPVQYTQMPSQLPMTYEYPHSQPPHKSSHAAHSDIVWSTLDDQ